MGTSLQGGRRPGWTTGDSQACKVLTLMLTLLPSALWSVEPASPFPTRRRGCCLFETSAKFQRTALSSTTTTTPPPGAKRRLPRCPAARTSIHSPSYLCFAHARFLSSPSGIPIRTFCAATFISCQINPHCLSPCTGRPSLAAIFNIKSRRRCMRKKKKNYTRRRGHGRGEGLKGRECRGRRGGGEGRRLLWWPALVECEVGVQMKQQQWVKQHLPPLSRQKGLQLACTERQHESAQRADLIFLLLHEGCN